VNIKNLISLCVLTGMIVGALSYFATAEQVKYLEQRQDYWITFDQFKATRDQIRDLETKCETGCSLKDKQDLKELIEDKEMLKEKMKSLEVK